jgi:hypothetical protein
MMGGVGVKQAAERGGHAFAKLQQKLQLWCLQQSCKWSCQYNVGLHFFCSCNVALCAASHLAFCIRLSFVLGVWLRAALAACNAQFLSARQIVRVA